VAHEAHETEWAPFQNHYYSENLVAPGIEPGTSLSVARNSDHLYRQETLYFRFMPMVCTQTDLGVVESSWNVMAHGDAREGKWRGNWRMEWVASTLHTTSELGLSSITTADAYTSAASSRPNWRPCWFKWTRPFRRKTKSGFYVCAITFQLASTTEEANGSNSEH
jgi:hypothetical protein